MIVWSLVPYLSLKDLVFSLEATPTEFSWRKLKTFMKWRTQDWECTTTGVSSYHLKLYLHTMNKAVCKLSLNLPFFIGSKPTNYITYAPMLCYIFRMHEDFIMVAYPLPLLTSYLFFSCFEMDSRTGQDVPFILTW